MTFYPDEKPGPTKPQTRFLFGALVVIGALSLLYPLVVYLLG